MARAPKEEQPPVFATEARENQLVNMAYDLVEQRLRDGTATSQEVTYIMKLGNERARLELDILRAQKELYEAKTDAIRSSERTEELYQQAIEAMRLYSGNQ